MTRLGLLFFALLLSAARATSDDAQARAQSAEFNKKAREAYGQKDWPGFLENAKKAEALRPGVAGLVFNVALAEARVGHPEQSARLLDGLLDRGLDFGVDEIEDFAQVRDTPAFVALARHAAELTKPVGHSDVAFRLPEKDLLTEGIAWDPQTKSFLMTSVHHRKIIRRGPDGSAKDFITEGQNGIDGVLAIRVDPSRRVLWACSAALPQMAGFDQAANGRSGLFAFDADKATLIASYPLAADGKPHALNDLTIAANGDVYTTDSLGSGVYRLPRGGQKLEEFVAPGVFRSPQGLAFSPDGKRLIVADWGDGLWSIDMATGRREPLSVPPKVELIGIDGLAAQGNVLVVVQNLVRPHRVTRLTIDASGMHVLAGEILVANDPEFSEPTLGAIVDGAFYVNAKSQWSLFDDDGKVATDKLQQPTILKIALPAGAR